MSSLEKRSPGYGAFRVFVGDSLTLGNVIRLMVYFDFSSAKQDELGRSSSPGISFVEELCQRGMIKETGISRFTAGLRALNLEGIADKIAERFMELCHPAEEETLTASQAADVGNVPPPPNRTRPIVTDSVREQGAPAQIGNQPTQQSQEALVISTREAAPRGDEPARLRSVDVDVDPERLAALQLEIQHPASYDDRLESDASVDQPDRGLQPTDDEPIVGAMHPESYYHQFNSSENLGQSDDNPLRPTLTRTCSYSSNRWTERIDAIKNSPKKKAVGEDVVFVKGSRIASGSDGTQVYVGLRADTPVAIKRLVSDCVTTEKEIFDSLRGITFTHVLRPHDYVEDDDFHYVLTRLCEYNIEELIEKKDCPMRVILEEKGAPAICEEFLKGLQELHGSPNGGILHRDIKPSNVLIDRDGKVLLSDFGVSRALSGQTSLVTKGVGTLCWMATEVMTQGDSVRYKKSADIQVAGFLCYYILTDGHIPHESKFPYKDEIHKAMKNLQENKFLLIHLADKRHHDIIKRMVDIIPGNRPDIATCVAHFAAT